jgi:septation ring formation regulator EzrA
MTKKKPPQEPHDLILDHLRALRSDTATIKAKLSDHDKKFSLVERQLTAIRRDIADIHDMFTDTDARHMSVEERLQRLERHAGLTETLQQ